jgi:hypothetical protein
MRAIRAEDGKSGVMRAIHKFLIIIAVSMFVFGVMQSFFGRPNCFDCRGYRYGFPFGLREEAGFVGPERTLWLGFLGDLAVAFGVGAFLVWLWRHAYKPK